MAIDNYIILSDQQLVDLAIGGDGAAFEHLTNRYRNSLFQLYIQRTGGDTDDVNDLLQETFLKVYLNLHRYNPTYTFGQWVYTIARNAFVDQVRKRRDDVSLDNLTLDSLQNIPASVSPTPEQSIINAQQRTELDDNLSKLSPRYRQLIDLRFYKEYSYEEIAHELNLPLGTVKTQIHRARQQLCKLITCSENM